MRLLTELWPPIERCTTAKELGAVILAAGVDVNMKRPLAFAARDRLGVKWSDRTVKEMLKPACHTEERADRQRKKDRAWRSVSENAERNREASRAWWAENCDDPAYQEKNRERTRYAARGEYLNDYQNARYRDDPVFTLARVARTRIAHALRAARAGKVGKTMDLLGCTPADFKAYLEDRFEPWMTWENYGSGPGA